jgi:hypothetical protein
VYIGSDSKGILVYKIHVAASRCDGLIHLELLRRFFRSESFDENTESMNLAAVSDTYSDMVYRKVGGSVDHEVGRLSGAIDINTTTRRFLSFVELIYTQAKGEVLCWIHDERRSRRIDFKKI